VERTPTEVVFVLDDGEEIRFDAAELQAATKSAGQGCNPRGRRSGSTSTPKEPPFDRS
jgi:hypothetical protein